ncbi:MAG TPA: response regulator [Phototrophicaceae bacterium]|nr:response regulator [Phototrophicaceae bacterium]
MSSGKILYVEDNPQNMRLIRKMLNTEYEMIEACNGEAGLQMAVAFKPALILMDVNLPDIDGLEVTAQLKSHAETAHIPIIALTANAMYGDRERFLAAGCDGYLAKPVTRNELLNTISYYMRLCNV